MILRRRPRVRGADPYDESSDPSTPEIIGVDAFMGEEEEKTGGGQDGRSPSDPSAATGGAHAANATKTYVVAADDAELRRILRKELERVS